MSAAPMIQFKCHCGQDFSVADDQAGGLIQCPRCGRLNDIPTLSDLKNLDAEGNYKISDLEVVDEKHRLEDLTLAFTRRRVDDEGYEIDLRSTLDEVAAAGADEIPLAGDPAAPPPAPKYDPLTGELIEPLAVRPDPAKEPVGVLPIATPTLGYATVHTHAVPPPVFLAIFRPENLFVLMIVGLLMVLCGIFQLFFAPISAITGIPPYALNILWWLFPAHYVVVLQEIAREERDELPRPWRDFAFGEDIWQPLLYFLVSLALSYGAAWAYAKFGMSAGGRAAPAHEEMILAGLLALGSWLFPVLLLTTTVSGSLNNLRPDRVMNAMIAMGWRYYGVVLAWMVTVVLSLYLVGGAALMPLPALRRAVAEYLSHGWMAFPLLFAQLYVAHWAAWQLAVLYRAHQPRFGWVLQEHVYKNRTRRMRRRPAPRAAAGAGVGNASPAGRPGAAASAADRTGPPRHVR
jgi:hypothetical protein